VKNNKAYRAPRQQRRSIARHDPTDVTTSFLLLRPHVAAGFALPVTHFGAASTGRFFPLVAVPALTAFASFARMPAAIAFSLVTWCQGSSD
jgi:hypothetical protein